MATVTARLSLLPTAPPAYSPDDQQRTRSMIQQALKDVAASLTSQLAGGSTTEQSLTQAIAAVSRRVDQSRDDFVNLVEALADVQWRTLSNYGFAHEQEVLRQSGDDALLALVSEIEDDLGDLADAVDLLPVATQVWDDHTLILFPEDATYNLILKAAYGVTITETVTRSTAGTCTATFQIEGTPLGGTANSVTTSEQSQAHSSANVVAAGNTLRVVLTSNSGCENLAISIIGTRVLAS